MKALKYLIGISLFFVLIGCGKPVNLSELQNRNGVYYRVNAEKTYSGKYISYHQNGQIEMKGNLKNGVSEGKQEAYYSNGQSRFNSEYKSGVLNGKFSAFYENGESKCILNYKNGNFDGKNTVFATFFNPKYEVTFKNGRVVKEVKYGNNGTIISEKEIGNSNFNSESIENFFRTQVLILNLI